MRASRAAVSVSRVCRALSCSQGSRRETRQVSARVWWQVLAGWLYKYAGSIKGTMYECMLYTHGVQAPPGARVKNVVCMMPQACHCTRTGAACMCSANLADQSTAFICPPSVALLVRLGDSKPA